MNEDDFDDVIELRVKDYESPENPLVLEPVRVSKPKWRTKMPVDAGTAAVITLDGRYKKTLRPGRNLLPGGYWFGLFAFRDCKVHLVDTKERQLLVQANLIVQNPVPIPVELSINVTYQVIEPKIIALDVDEPLRQLYAWILEAMRDAINRLHFDEFLEGGQAVFDILQQLERRHPEQALGIKVLKVQVNELQADEEIRARTERRWEFEDVRNRNHIAKAIELTPEYILYNNPELFGNIFVSPETRFKEIVGLVKAGLIDASTLNDIDPNFAKALSSGLGGGSGTLSSSRTPPQLGKVQASTSKSAVQSAERIRAEVGDMLAQGYEAALYKEDSQGYIITLKTQSHSKVALEINAICSQEYPTKPPQVFVELDGVEKNFNPQVVTNWNDQHTILDIVEEALAFFS